MFRLQIRSLARGAAGRAMAAAAQRAGEWIQRKDVVHAEIMVPAKLAGTGGDWARDRSKLWNAAAQAETDRTARVAREFQVTLPAELSAPQRLTLARAFSQDIADRYGIAVDLAVHEPRAGGDPRNFHAHLLATTRELTPAGLGAKSGLDMDPENRARLGLPGASQQFTDIRTRWARLTNETLHAAGIEAHLATREERAAAPDGAGTSVRRSGPRSLREIGREAARSWTRMRVGRTEQASGHTAAVQDSAASHSDDSRAEERAKRSSDRALDDDHLP